MGQAELIGTGVIVLGTLITFIISVQKFTQPINDLRLEIQKLNDTIESLHKDTQQHANRLDRHRAEIEDLQIRVNRIETKMDMCNK